LHPTSLKKDNILSILTASQIQKSYGPLHVLKGVDLTVEKGEVVTIVGKSGAGKSTLLHILGTLDTADQGTVTIDGMEITSMREKDLASFRNKTIGFIFQFHHLLPEFTALENVCIPAMIHAQSKQKSITRAKELLDYLGLSQRLEHKPNALSGGEQQRVAVARALMNHPALILADEPTGNLDTETSQDIHRLFLRLRKDFGKTFIIVTHNQDLAQLSDRNLVMQDGMFVRD
jgi:lipoprotein-releasing system ATP-binding protein